MSTLAGRTHQLTQYSGCVALGNGKKLHLAAKNLDRDGLNHYVQSVTLNGVDLPNAWFRHDQIKDGATLVFTMGFAPTNWGKATPPPSMSDSGFQGCAASPQPAKLACQ